MLFSISTFRFSGQVQDFKTVFSIVNNPNFPFREAFPDFVMLYRHWFAADASICTGVSPDNETTASADLAPWDSNILLTSFWYGP
ncbi:hypothetical protein PAPYR_12900 [Paratrimastix pyriformis]|uniref:Uncharacterized protein n=1 Tax=Paratrimastix pyriformis TaxID=342808 RepID=A0ABQ8U4Q8_9EUKA|nr:hypothetical protein PAPYR_12900 [Paratrimastix pyriformis]